MNPDTQRIVAFLEGAGNNVIRAARRKCAKPNLAVGALTKSGGDSAALGFCLALATEVARHGSHFSQSTLDKVDWERVAAHFSKGEKHD